MKTLPKTSRKAPSGRPVENARAKPLSACLSMLERRGELLRIVEPVSTVLEITEIHKRVLRQGGPVLLFEKPVLPDGSVSDIPVVVNLFGTVARVADAMGCTPAGLTQMGHWLGSLRQPEPPSGMREILGRVPDLRAAMSMTPMNVRTAPVQARVLKGKRADLGRLPIQTCWPGEPAPLITWPLVITRPPDSTDSADYNMGVYRMQVNGPQQAIMRWLAHRGGAAHHRQWQAVGEDMPAAIAIGADPATIMAAVTPLPDDMSEYHYAGLLRGRKMSLVKATSVPLMVPAEAEIIIEGWVSATDTAPEGPYGDHTGYYNAVEEFPVFNVTAITMRDKPVYLSTYTGRPPDEPSIISQALNDVYLPLLQQQFPEIVDCWLPPEACSYRIAVVSIKKRYPGQARRIMMGLWSHLYQFTYTKMIIVVDADIDVRDWADVMWAVSTRMDSSRDLVTVDSTPMDYLDFASPVSGLGGKLGIDATNKLDGETTREWGRVLEMDPDVIARVDKLWNKLGMEQS